MTNGIRNDVDIAQADRQRMVSAVLEALVAYVCYHIDGG